MSEDKKWLDTVIPKIAEGIGSHVEDVRYELVKSLRSLMSYIYFVCVKYTNNLNQMSEECSFVIKKSTGCDSVSVGPQFSNEILFYQMYRRLDENFPRYFYSHEPLQLTSTDWVIAFEDVGKLGFEACPYNYDAPYEYILAVVRELGRFHAKGYVMKEKNRAEFFRIVGKIKETRYDETTGKWLKGFINYLPIRAVEYLRDHGHDPNFCNKMEAVLSNAFKNVMTRVAEPSEPLSTICHGDATLNNVFFKTRDDGQFDAMLIDFALLRYGTPVIDLSTFLYLSCTNSMMREKFFDILTVYHTELTNRLLQEGFRDIRKYSYNAILDDYKRGCVFGFVIASFYLPVLMGIAPNLEMTYLDDTEFFIKQSKECGGEKMSAIFAEMLLQISDLGGLDHIL
ncbi:PREDICTED: uncharacterized protein LOC106749180 [Dinoponera quadriceps]|uniref:Uncharacterized protein LOC106749180 n=1 Tax=Dinoponera quadriceps TaxID=609295 RepID=A0A6P3Y0W5_DINQU|nr:PREDICTED: uncharacterized protein LOC106749180 [Dinoponera quadriceps]